MRVIGEIDHPSCKITLFQWNGKYIIKLEQGLLEQTYKVGETDITGENDIKRILNDTFMQAALKRFREMHLDLVQSMETL